MSSWGPGILQDDVAVDVQDQFENAINRGLRPEDATNYVLEHSPWGLEDDDDRCTTFLTLATLQLKHNSLHADIRDKALEIIDGGEALDRWIEAPEASYQSRQQILERLRVLLLKRSCSDNELQEVIQSQESLW